jgi:multidrug resistance efflux pump
MGDKGRSKKKSKRRRVRWPIRLLMALCAAAMLFLLGFVWLYHARNDAALARYIMEDKNPKIRGRLELGKVHWGHVLWSTWR